MRSLETCFLSRCGLWLGSALLIATLAAGCSSYRPAEHFQFDATGLPQSYKRIERDITRQFTTHWSRTAFRKPSVKKLAKSKAESEQKVIMEQWGAPDWVRKFRSLQNESVEEWLYPSQGTLFQFVGGELVYNGPMTDLEQILLDRGYPDRVEFIRNNLDNREYQLFYFGVFHQDVEQYNLFNDKLITSIEGN